jgi:hypothetical protein
VFFSIIKICKKDYFFQGINLMEVEVRDGTINSDHMDRPWWTNPSLVGGGGGGG